MIKKKFYHIKATVTDGNTNLGIFEYSGTAISDIRLVKLARKEYKNELVTLVGIVRKELVYEMTDSDFMKYGTCKEN